MVMTSVTDKVEDEQAILIDHDPFAVHSALDRTPF
jgi:hypothetical protein